MAKEQINEAISGVEKNYNAHRQFYPNGDTEKREAELKKIFTNSEYRCFLNQLRYDKIMPLVQDCDRWLTLGDYCGEEAAWLAPHCKAVIASDICTSYLEVAQLMGYIVSYSQQNAEAMTFENHDFDFVLCRESLHHFPRPYLAVYEMLRCAKKGIIINEPLDPLSKYPPLLFLCNVLDTRKHPIRSFGVWKNRFSFETVGNYIYKVSQREFEKLAMGIGLPAVAFCYSNDSCVNFLSDIKKTRRQLRKRNLLSALRIVPYQTLTAVLFKETPDEETVNRLWQKGYAYYELPPNPYL